MLHPSYKEMINKMNDTANNEDMEITSRYSLVIAAAKRARQINSGSEPLVPAKIKEKNLSVAVEELFAGKVHILNEEAASEESPEEEVRDELSAGDAVSLEAADETPDSEPENDAPEEETLPEETEDQ